MLSLRAAPSFPRAGLMAAAAVAVVLGVNLLSLWIVQSGLLTIEWAERARTLVWAAGTVVFIILSSIAVGTFASSIARGLRISEAEQRKVFWGFSFAGPWLVGFVIFVLGPAIASFIYSFTDYKLGESMQWVGLDNYRTLLMGEGAHGRRFAQAMYNSFYYALLGVPLQILASLIMALLLNASLKGMKVFRLIFYLPVILAGGPAILLAWRYMLASNGGFINEFLTAGAESFFLFDWLYRGFIYGVEGFNGFYAGIARGNPIGPLAYTIPAFIGGVILLSMVAGEWSINRRMRAWRTAELIGMVVTVILMARALVQEPLDPAFLYMGGLIAVSMITVNLWAGRTRAAFVWQVGTIILCVIAAMVVLVQEIVGGEGDITPYLTAIGVIGLPVVLSLIDFPHTFQKRAALAGTGVLVVILLAMTVPSQFSGDSAGVLPRYLAFGSAIAQPGDLDYLDDVLPNTMPSPLWIWGLVAVVTGAIAALHTRYPQVRRALIIAGASGFTLLAASSLIDGIRYFQAFDGAAVAAGQPVYHFSLFRQAMASWPDADRVPLWLTNELWAKPSLILITLWSSGAGMLIFLAALKGVPESLYEAAKVDGANQVQRFFSITLPMISPAMFYNVVIGIIAALQTFETVYIIANTQTQDSLASAAFFLYVRTFRQLAIGEGSAVSWTLAVVIVMLTVLQFRYSNWVHYEVD
ncbi:MAG: sugar ABC transporter permease [Anaerolineae bacterium]|nr:sugar ABC transporter permease [Anaerolineae bacterium]